jgi:hypothetical protein
MKRKQSIEDFLQRISIFPLVEGTVTKQTEQGCAIDIKGLELHAECPDAESTAGLQVGEVGLFYVLHCDSDGLAMVSYKKGVEYEAFYNYAIGGTILHPTVLPAPEQEQAPVPKGVGVSIDEVMLTGVTGLVPNWAAEGVNLLEFVSEKVAVKVIGLSVQEEQLIALLSYNKALAVEDSSQSLSHPVDDSEVLKDYLSLFKTRNFMMGQVLEFCEQGTIIGFDFGVTGLLTSEGLQAGEKLSLHQAVGVIIKGSSESEGLLLTRCPLEVFNAEPWE